MPGMQRIRRMLGYLFGSYSNVYQPAYPPPVASPPPIGVGQFEALQHRVDSLELACAALWRLLKQANGSTDEQLKALIHEVDAADGTVDGRITPVAGNCPQCGHRILSRTAGKCLWCGAPLTTGAFNEVSPPPG